MRRLGMIATGLVVCGIKGLLWWRPYGFGTAAMQTIWDEQYTLPRGSVWHHRTDLIVEWASQNPQQRGVKLLCALALVMGAAGFGIGLLF